MTMLKASNIMMAVDEVVLLYTSCDANTESVVAVSGLDGRAARGHAARSLLRLALAELRDRTG